MTLTRRTALTLTMAALAAPALIRPAAAGACIVPDLDKGVTFKRKDGSVGVAQRQSDGLVRIDYVTNRGAWTDIRRVRNGVFEVSRIVEESEYEMVGASAPSYTWTYSPKPVTLTDGVTWTGKVKELREVTISDEAGTVHSNKRRWQATYTCFEPREVTLSGCTLAALTVEAVLKDGTDTLRQRWVYFPAIDLGLETRRGDKTNGIVALGAPVA